MKHDNEVKMAEIYPCYDCNEQLILHVCYGESDQSDNCFDGNSSKSINHLRMGQVAALINVS